METIRSIKVTIEVDTNKSTYTETLEPYNNESNEEFIKRITDNLEERLL